MTQEHVVRAMEDARTAPVDALAEHLAAVAFDPQNDPQNDRMRDLLVQTLTISEPFERARDAEHPP